MRNVKFYSLLFIIGIVFHSCSKEKYEAQVPAYISINDITLITSYATEGSASENITDAWVYVDDDLVGVYELPATFPVLKEGNATLKIYAGIKDNGVSASRKRYLLYDPYVEQLNLVRGETINITPTITYNSGAKFTWMEDFENASLSFLYTTGSDTVINKTTTNVKEGTSSGRVYLDAGMDFFETTSVAYSSLPHNGTPIYLEMDFITNEPVIVGIYADTDQKAVVTLNTTSEWKKIYINLTDVINTSLSSAAIKVFLGIKATENDPFISANPEIYLDNIKLVHY